MGGIAVAAEGTEEVLEERKPYTYYELWFSKSVDKVACVMGRGWGECGVVVEVDEKET